jgi:hypothetical protein
MSQIRVLNEVIQVLVPLKENLDGDGGKPAELEAAALHSTGPNPPIAATANVRAQFTP